MSDDLRMAAERDRAVRQAMEGWWPAMKRTKRPPRLVSEDLRLFALDKAEWPWLSANLGIREPVMTSIQTMLLNYANAWRYAERLLARAEDIIRSEGNPDGINVEWLADFADFYPRGKEQENSEDE